MNEPSHATSDNQWNACCWKQLNSLSPAVNATQKYIVHQLNDVLLKTFAVLHTENR